MEKRISHLTIALVLVAAFAWLAPASMASVVLDTRDSSISIFGTVNDKSFDASNSTSSLTAPFNQTLTNSATYATATGSVAASQNSNLLFSGGNFSGFTSTGSASSSAMAASSDPNATSFGTSSNAFSTSFIVTGQNVPYQLTGNIGGTGMVSLQFDNLTTGDSLASLDTASPISLSGILTPGTYAVSVTLDTDVTGGDVLTTQDGTWDLNLALQTVPEPATLAMLFAGSVLLAGRRKKAAA